MLASISLLRENPNQIMFRPGFLGLLINPSYLIRAALYRAVSLIAEKMKGKILDFGCGSKPYAHLFVEADSYTGIDIEISGHDHQASQVDVFFDGANIPFPDEHFDGVVTFETLEHVFDIDHAAREFHRVLKKNGQLLVTIPFAWPEHEQPYDFGRYTCFGITAILQRHGFEIKQIKKTGGFFLAVSQLWIEYIRSLIFPHSRAWRAVINMIFVFPFTALVIVLNFLAPKNDNLYFNLVVQAQKIG
jgi:SAM-dependent methyltransferase